MPKDTTKVSKRATKEEGKQRRAKKDKSGPKRGLSAYMFFSQENRAQIKEDNPDASFGTIGKLLGDKWKKMTDDDKAPYVAKANTDKERYEAEKKAYAGK
ncbi:high mobility group box domain-containing protein [Circinella umbellata]|nr:high mobility group box domain-containing protein [Circinella umbellata]